MVDFQCSEVAAYLDDIWREFRKRGVSDELRVIEGLALMLLGEKVGIWEEITDGSLVPHIDGIDMMLSEKMEQYSVPEFSDLSEYGLDSDETFWSVLHTLRRVFDVIPHARLFDQCIIPRITTMTRGGRYPTPRHLTHWMAELVAPKDGETLADFACGSGGFLVAPKNRTIRITGIEISPNWARISETNTILHDLHKPTILIGNTFTIIGGSIHQAEYDCILMNPPFGELIDPSLISQYFGDGVSGRSETLFCALAYDKLKHGGRMAVMLPNGSLFANSFSEQGLRDNFLEDNALKAVISLPKDALQPYSTLQTHVLVIHKPLEEEPTYYNDIWFFRARSDGYTSGRNRLPDPGHNDLPLISASITKLLVSNAQPQGKPAVDISIHKSAEKVLGYHFASIGDISFKLYNLRLIKEYTSWIYLLETKTNNYEDLICVANEMICRGQSDIKYLSPKYSNSPNLQGEYLFVDEELEKCRIYIDKDTFEIKKGDILVASSLQENNPASDDIYGIFVDTGGVPHSSILRVKKDGWLEDRIFPTFLDLCDINGVLSGTLVLFSTQGVMGCELTSENGNKCYLFRNNANKLAIIWLVFGESNSLVYKTNLDEVFNSDSKQIGCILNEHNDVIGIGIPASVIFERKDHNLLPVNYFPPEVAEIQVRSTAEILAEIKINQNRLVDRIDRLMGVAELGPIAGALLPPKAAKVQTLPGNLRGTQKVIWEEVKKKVEKSPDQKYITPKPFQADDLKVGVPTSDVQRALELFECMGLLVRVSYADVPYFRLLTESDVIGRKT